MDTLTATRLAKDVEIKRQAEAALGHHPTRKPAIWILGVMVGLAFASQSAVFFKDGLSGNTLGLWLLAITGFTMAAACYLECIYLRRRLDALVVLHQLAQRNTDL